MRTQVKLTDGSMLIVKWFSQQLYMSLLPPTGQPHNENKTQNGVNTSIKKRTKCLFYYYIYTEIIFLQAI